jgi:hypothetical protein
MHPPAQGTGLGEHIPDWITEQLIPGAESVGRTTHINIQDLPGAGIPIPTPHLADESPHCLFSDNSQAKSDTPLRSFSSFPFTGYGIGPYSGKDYSSSLT